MWNHYKKSKKTLTHPHKLPFEQNKRGEKVCAFHGTTRFYSILANAAL